MNVTPSDNRSLLLSGSSGATPPSHPPTVHGMRAALAWLGVLVLLALGGVLAAAWFFEERAAWMGFVLYAMGCLAISGRLVWYLLERRRQGDGLARAWRLGCRAAADATLAAPLLLLDSLGVKGLGIATGVVIFVSDAFDRLAEGPSRGERPFPWFSGTSHAAREERLPGALPPG